jgi:hypothetical protein
MSTLWGPPQIDLFASRQSAQMQRFYSWKATDVPEAIDALSLRWNFMLAFLFPPIPLKRVIRKLELSRGTFLLVTPYWEAQTWFASLQALQVEDVRRLPFSDDLVIDLTTGEPPPNLERLFLVVWKVLGSRRRLGQVLPPYFGRMEAILRRPLRKSVAILKGLSPLFLHSTPSGVSEERLGLPDDLLRSWPFVEYHRHTQIHPFYDDGTNRWCQGWGLPTRQNVDELGLQ